MTGEENPSGFSAIASRFEKANESDGPGAKIADISSRFQSSTSSSATFKKPSPTAPTTSGGASAIAARNAPVKEHPEDDVPTKSVADVAARFRSAEKSNAEPTENAFSAAKGAFLKAEASRTTDDVETKVKAAASMFGDTVGNSKKPSPLPTKTDTSSVDNTPVSRVSTEKGPGVAAAAEMFQNNNASRNTQSGDDTQPELSGSEKFANAAKMFGGQ